MIAPGNIHNGRAALRRRDGPPRDPRLHIRGHELCHRAGPAHWLRRRATDGPLRRRAVLQGSLCQSVGILCRGTRRPALLPRVCLSPSSFFVLAKGPYLSPTRSPYFLVNHGRPDKARKNLERLHGPDYDYDGHMANIQEILDAENASRDSQGGIRDCFSQQHWKRTMVATSMFFIQNACGSAWVVGYMSCE